MARPGSQSLTSLEAAGLDALMADHPGLAGPRGPAVLVFERGAAAPAGTAGLG